MTEPDRPFTLPPGEYKPKQSLSQNFLSDQNYVKKIVDEFVNGNVVSKLMPLKDNPIIKQ